MSIVYNATDVLLHLHTSILGKTTTEIDLTIYEYAQRIGKYEYCKLIMGIRCVLYTLLYYCTMLAYALLQQFLKSYTLIKNYLCYTMARLEKMTRYTRYTKLMRFPATSGDFPKKDGPCHDDPQAEDEEWGE